MPTLGIKYQDEEEERSIRIVDQKIGEATAQFSPNGMSQFRKFRLLYRELMEIAPWKDERLTSRL
ncbi:hypothetical protein MLD52_14545 [Puniceicoccaceae bacterium K14]|nr:hypothetical protein [Puniceicoccaceae bacterium K14]